MNKYWLACGSIESLRSQGKQFSDTQMETGNQNLSYGHAVTSGLSWKEEVEERK